MSGKNSQSKDTLNLGTDFWKRFAENEFLCFLCTDNQGNITYINQVGERLYGYSNHELIGKHVGILYQGIKLTESMYKTLKQKSLTGEPWEAELLNIRKNGKKFPVWTATHYIFDDDGNRKGALSITRDISEEVKAREEARYLANLTEQVNLALISTDEKGKIISVNQAAEKLFGYTLNEIIGKSISIIYSKNNPPKLMEKIKSKLIEKKGYTAELMRRKKDGTEFLTWLSTAPLHNKDGKFQGFIGVGRDITKEKEIRERIHYLAQLVESAAHCIISTDPKGIIKSINKAGEKMYGYKMEELIGKHVQKIQSPNISKKLMAELDKKAKKGENWETESLGIRKDGETFPIWLSTSYLFDENKKIKGTIGISRDITQEKAALEQIEWMAELVNRAHFSIVSTDTQDIIRSINHAGEMIYGYKAADLVGKNQEVLYQGVTLPDEKLKELQEKKKKGEWWVEEIYNVRKNGEIFPIRVATEYLFDEEGKRKGAVSIAQDVTEESEAREKVRYTAELVDRACFCILSTDENGIIKSINPAGERMLRYKADDLIGKNQEILYRGLPPISRNKLVELKNKKEKGEGWVEEFHSVRSNGEIFPVRIATAYLFDKMGKRKGTVSITQDITQERALKDELIESSKLASLGEVAAGIAHEIRNPLSAIMNIVYICAKEPIFQENAIKKQMMEDLKTEIKRLDQISSDFIDFARPKQLRKQSTNINDIIIDTIRFFKHDEEVGKGIQFQEKLGERGELLLDANQIKQVVSNLILNSLQAMKGKGTLTIASFEKDNYVGFSIQDTGPGISDQDRERIFEPFFSTKTKGCGLGMSIVKRIVDQHNGIITVNSKHGKGTKVVVLLPTN